LEPQRQAAQVRELERLNAQREASIAALSDERNNLSQQCQSLLAERDAHSAKLHSLLDEARTLSVERQAIDAKFQSLSETAGALLAERHAFDAKHRSLSEEARALAEQNAQLLSAVEALSAERDDLRQSVDAKRSEDQARQAQLGETQARLRQIRVEFYNLQHALDNAERQIANVSERYKGAVRKRKLKALRRRLWLALTRPPVPNKAYRLVSNSALFERHFYLSSNPDVRAAGMDPVVHYLKYGSKEGRDPSPYVSEAAYRNRYPDVSASGMSLVEHYEKFGRSEGRWILGDQYVLDPSGDQYRLEPLDAANDLTELKVIASQGEPSLDTLTAPINFAKSLYLRRCNLSVFRTRNTGPISFLAPEKPFFSVVISAYDNFRYTIRLLEILEHAICYANAKKAIGIEIVVVDNGSKDETTRLQDFATGITLRRVSPNIGFPRACNLGASLAKGEYLVFVNNDVEFEPDVFVRLHDAVERDKGEVACFGAAILQFDVSIQDLGSGVWRDGVAQGYFRNEPPTRYSYSYPRDVDYVAGCFFCISAAEFRDFNGFDEVFSPGYYEESDLCLRIQKAGRISRVYPDICIYHLEYGAFSAKRPKASVELMERNKPVFAERHKEVLEQRPEYKPNAGYPTITANTRLRILFVEDRVPVAHMGAGFGRSETILRALLENYDVDIFACHGREQDSGDFNYVDITYGPEPELLQRRLSERHYDVIYICRPHNIARFEHVLRSWKSDGGSVVYDTEAIFAVRDVAQEEAAETYSQITGSARLAELIGRELRPAEVADVIIAVNDKETAILRRYFGRPVLTIGHHLPIRVGGLELASRSGLLFVGALWEAQAPNYESLVWFLKNVWPRIRAIRPQETLRIAGYLGDQLPTDPLCCEGVTILGPVPDLTAEYGSARAFIAPTRFAAGIPFKVHEAFSYGLPVVCSRLISEQVARNGEVDGLISASVRDDGTEFAEASLRMLTDDDLWVEKRKGALEYIGRYCAPSNLNSNIAALFAEFDQKPDFFYSPSRRTQPANTEQN
jgi:GT2 family glycosyltransferase